MARRAPADEKPFRPLDTSVLNAVMQHVPTVAPMESPRAEPVLRVVEPKAEPLRLVKKLDQEKRILFTREETHAIDRLVNGLAQRLQAQVKASHVFRALTILLQGRTGLVIAHRLATVRRADKIMVLQNGCLIEAGNHLELLAENGLYASLYRASYASFDDAPMRAGAGGWQARPDLSAAKSGKKQ